MVGNILEYPNPRPLVYCKKCDGSDWKLVVENSKATMICAACGAMLHFRLED